MSDSEILVTTAPIVAFELGAAAVGLSPAEAMPRLSHAECAALREVIVVDESCAERSIYLPTEHPLTLVVDGEERVTLMTLGGAPEFMVLGFLLNQRFITNAAALASIIVDWRTSTAVVTRLRPAEAVLHATRHTALTGTGHGSVFADLMSQIESIRLAAADQPLVTRDTVLRILEIMRQHDFIHRKAGSVHSCALFEGPELLMCVEDVGRHNGLDTVSGWMALHGIAGGDKILFTTGRLTSEMVMKTALSGIPIAVSRNGVSAMGYDLAVRLGMTLIGRAANQRFSCYTGRERLSRP